jgi:hypothetical protein
MRAHSMFAAAAMLNAAVFAVAGQAQAEPAWFTEDFQGGKCTELETGNVDAGEDYIIRQCESFPGIYTYLFYQEGLRLSVGFGSKPNTVRGGTDANRGDWPIVWGGEKRNGKFIPQVAIGRFTNFGEEPSVQRLTVFRLLDNGMACVVGDARKNEEARAIAIAAMKKWKCEGEPEPLELK